MRNGLDTTMDFSLKYMKNVLTVLLVTQLRYVDTYWSVSKTRLGNFGTILSCIRFQNF